MRPLTNALLGKSRCHDAYFTLHLGTFFALAGPAVIKALANLILPLARTYLGKSRCHDAYIALHLGTFFALAGPALMKALADPISPLARTYENLHAAVPEPYII